MKQKRKPKKKPNRKPKGFVTHEEEILLKMLHQVIEKKMEQNEKSHTHIVNGGTHFDYSNLNRDRKKKFNSKILTFRRKCKAMGILFGDCINEAEQLTAAHLEEERKHREQKRKEILRGG